MKKEYIKPATYVEAIEFEHICAASGITMSADGNSGEGILNEQEATGEGLSKRSIWFEED